jgi:hypothetical protein
MVKFVVGGRWSQRQLAVGEPLTRTFSTRAIGAPATLRRPDGREESIRLTQSDEIASMTYDDADHSGIYEISLGPPVSRSELIAVNVDPAESDLTRIESDEIKTELGPAGEFVEAAAADASTRRTGGADATPGPLSRWLLVGLFGLLFVEQLMAWRFTFGAILLSAVAAAGLVLLATSWNIAAGVALAVAAGIGGLLATRAARLRYRSGSDNSASFRR